MAPKRLLEPSNGNLAWHAQPFPSAKEPRANDAIALTPHEELRTTKSAGLGNSLMQQVPPRRTRVSLATASYLMLPNNRRWRKRSQIPQRVSIDIFLRISLSSPLCLALKKVRVLDWVSIHGGTPKKSLNHHPF